MFTANDVDFDNERVFNSKFQRYMNRGDIMEAMLAISDKLANAYHILKLYQTFNSECPPEAAREQFEAVYEEFVSYDIPAYREFVNLMDHWKEEIIYSFERPNGRKQSNSLTENINSQIRTYLAVSRGSSNFERFRRRILYCLNKGIFYHCTEFLTSLKEDHIFSLMLHRMKLCSYNPKTRNERCVKPVHHGFFVLFQFFEDFISIHAFGKQFL